MSSKGEVEDLARVDVWLQQDGLDLLSGWSREGLNLEEIAEKMGVGVATLRRWRKKYPDMEEALQKGSDAADIAVESALFKRAVGYVVEEVTKQLDKSGELVVVKVVQKVVEPNVTAQLFWLKNRRPDLWSERVDMTDKLVEVVFSVEAESLGG